MRDEPDGASYLKDVQVRYRSLVESIPLVTYIDEIDGGSPTGYRSLYMSPQVEDLLGYPAEAFQDLGFYESLYHPDDAARVLANDVRYFETGEPLVQEFRMRHSSGSFVWIREEARVLEGESGSVVSQGFLLDVTARRDSEAAVRARDLAEAASRAKSEFLSRMSHELRTPLNAIIGFGRLLAEAELSAPEQESADHILRAGRRLSQLIDDVLDISRLETGRFAVSIEPVDLGEVLGEVVAQGRALAAEHGIRMETSLTVSAYGLTDHSSIRQILIALLSHSVRRASGRVVVRIEPAGDELFVHIENDHPEEDSDFASNAFLPFETLTAPQEGYADTGLALALAKRLADATGALLYASVEPGLGTTLSLRVPATQDPLARLRPADGGHEEDGRGGTVLYIEDNPSNLALIERVLNRFPGVRLLGTGLGKLGVDLARIHLPTVVLLDIDLPDISGHEVLGLLKADPSTELIPVIVLSAHDAPARVKRAKEEGALDYFPKPIDIGRLLEVIDGLLRRVDHHD